MTNNPLRYTDPTGHKRVEDEFGGSTRGCSDPRYCRNGKPKPKEELANMRKRPNGGGGPGGEQVDPLRIYGGEYIFGLENRGLLASWNGDKEIDPAEWEALLHDIGTDVHSSSTGWYDTPLFDGYGFLSGRGCINGKCYDRSELNYIGEGEALAALGLSREATHNVVWAWKNKGPFMLGILGLDSTPREVSQGTKEMTDIGWHYYNEHYSSPSNNVIDGVNRLISMITPPGTASSLWVP